MSNHFCTSKYQGHDVQVTLGYDRPLKHVFLTVLRTDSEESEPIPASALEAAATDDLEADDGDDGIVYSNLSDPAAGFSRGLDYYREKLSSLGITVPDSMFRETEQDSLARAGNRVVRHYDDGRLETLQAD